MVNVLVDILFFDFDGSDSNGPSLFQCQPDHLSTMVKMSDPDCLPSFLEMSDQCDSGCPATRIHFKFNRLNFSIGSMFQHDRKRITAINGCFS
jgi:hypothetical protein